MLTAMEVLWGIVLPAVVAGVIALIARWRRWDWAMPVAVGVGFVVAYAVMGRPKLPPSNGNDWLFWLAVPRTVLGVVDALVGGRWGWVMGVSAGIVALVVLWPISAGIEARVLWGTVVGMTAAGVALAWVAGFARMRMGDRWIIGAFAIVLGAAGLVTFSSNLRTTGVNGLSAGAAVAAAALLGRGAARSVVILVVPLLAGFLVAGRFYPEPGVTWTNVIVLMGAPVLLIVGALVPVRRGWVRGMIGLLAVAIAVAAVAGPTALKAKAAAETVDPYDAYR
ncbi:MAG TPA: hypothetical protein VH475_28520 [Tepidisphaeraceae bacterium]